MAVEEDGPVDPAVFLGPDADPGMVDAAGIAHHQLAGYLLGPEHGGHHGRIVEADALLDFQNIIQIGQIAALDGGCLFLVIGHILHHIVVNRRHLFQGMLQPGTKLRTLLHRIGGRQVIHILVWPQEGGKLILQGCLKFRQHHHGIFRAPDIAVDACLITAVAVGQGEHCPLSSGKVIVVCSGGALQQHLQPLVRLPIVEDHDIAVFCVGVVHHRIVAALFPVAGSLRLQNHAGGRRNLFRESGGFRFHSKHRHRFCRFRCRRGCGFGDFRGSTAACQQKDQKQ